MPDDRFLHRRAGHSEKVNLLTDLEFRAWTQYLLSADDFGVMRASAVTLQADNDHLANRPAKVVQRCIDTLVKVGLVRVFDHQKRSYVFQHDWQSWQKVSYPRATNQPPPPSELIAECDEATRRLFSIHPGGAGRRRNERSENVSETVVEDSALTRARTPAKRLTANGYRLTATGSEGGPGETNPPFDAWFQDLLAVYPKSARSSGYATETAFCVAVQSHGTPAVTFTVMLGNLENQKRGYQWRVKRMIPRLERWLKEGLWQQVHEEGPPAAEQVTAKTSVTLNAAANILREAQPK